MNKMVNGVEVAMTDQEVADRQAEDAAWAAAAPARDVEAKKTAALGALQDQVLAAATKDPNAPQAVKDYAAAEAAVPVQAQTDAPAKVG